MIARWMVRCVSERRTEGAQRGEAGREKEAVEGTTSGEAQESESQARFPFFFFEALDLTSGDMSRFKTARFQTY